MATMRDPKKAHTAFGSRQSPYLTSVSVATQSQASISRVTLSLRSPKSTPSTQCVILRYEEDQNDMPRLSPWAADSLTPAPFLDTLEIQPEESDEGSDEEGDEINVAFLPYFYGECHGIVFWEYIQDFKRGQVLGSACVTACTEEDLRRYGLVDYIGLMDVKSALGPVGPQSTEGADVMHSVGVEKGRWLEKNVVEDWEEWRSGGARLGLVLCIGIVGWR
ncbi:hypothetical protein N0V91_007018 [Didymella pomorum]|uniref:Uncharacterized protein n=1 Tax=Didymella pomorum TaxID=749634 RepID=A0A9W9D5B5_9PLEO|nr:hypothetical protein N0V91_007018 [Didymella pomorum]